MPLSMVGTGDMVTIMKIKGTDEARQHLAELGFIPGEEISIVNQVSGNLIIQVKDSRVALDRSMANRIYI